MDRTVIHYHHVYLSLEGQIQSSEGTVQGDLVAMPIYALSVIPGMLILVEITNTKTGKQILTL